jgi:hypothetical protein
MRYGISYKLIIEYIVSDSSIDIGSAINVDISIAEHIFLKNSISYIFLYYTV